MDCSIDWTDTKQAWVSVDDRAMINKVLRLKEEHPDDVKILNLPETNSGMMVAVVPKPWIKIRPPRKMSDEQKAKMSDRLARVRKSHIIKG